MRCFPHIAAWRIGEAIFIMRQHIMLHALQVIDSPALDSQDGLDFQQEEWHKDCLPLHSSQLFHQLLKHLTSVYLSSLPSAILLSSLLTTVSTEMIQTGAQMASAKPSTPPSSPNLSSSVDMQMASAAPPENPLEATSTDLCSLTPCHTPPTNESSSQVVTVQFAQQFLDVLKSLSAKQGPPPPGKPSKATGDVPSARASRLEFKTVHEVYVFCEFQVQPCCS
jgi:hypothetical protein